MTRVWNCCRFLGISGLICCTVIGGSMPLAAQTNRTVSGAKVGVIETAELSKLVLERMNVLEKSKAEGKNPPPAQFVLVDVRSAREMSVSVIPTAVSKAEFEKNLEKYRGAVVIPYCTIGGRCGDFSQQLAHSGWTVKSYRGSIIEWVQNELPLITPRGERTSRLHTNGVRFDLPANYQTITN